MATSYTLNKKYYIQTSKSTLFTIDSYLTDKECEQLFHHLSSYEFNVKPEIIIYGKRCHQQRDILFFSDESKGYAYSGQKTPTLPLSEELKELIERINKDFHTTFNGILVNRYNSGTEYIGAHSDDERGLSGELKKVVALSLGVSRLFRLRKKETKEKVLDVETWNGQIIMMEGEFQKEFIHEVPVQKRVKGSRISLTFRDHRE